MVRIQLGLHINVLQSLLFFSFFHSSFTTLLSNVHTAHTKFTQHREENEEGGVFSFFQKDSGHHTKAPRPQWLPTYSSLLPASPTPTLVLPPALLFYPQATGTPPPFSSEAPAAKATTTFASHSSLLDARCSVPSSLN